MKFIFKGVVQGVGFRPTVYRIAQQLGLKGYVLNTGSEVEVVIDKDEDLFLKTLQENLPSIAKITSIEKHPDTRTFSNFHIRHSRQGDRHSLVPVDIALCEDCYNELFDQKNRRYQYPFTNCTRCGARFSLITDVPYDRERTAMKPFPLCTTCQKEYITPTDRRYHAQTISCPKCGPEYHLYDKHQTDLGSKQAIQKFAHALDEGAIGVIKSWGGMHLCCKLSELERFRRWYGRPQKSFAVMINDIQTAQNYATLTKQQKLLLTSNKRPIVLAEKKQAELASPGLNTIGLFLPYTGVHHLLFSHLSTDALVMTSANLPGEPMLIENTSVFGLGAEYYLLHNRMIPNRVDDTVLKTWKNHTFFLRKSRGYIPDPIAVPYSSRIASVGPDENITGALSVDKQLFCTQYIGNSKYYSTLEFLESALKHLMHLFMKKPQLDGVAMDIHPGYDSREIAKKLAETFHVSTVEVQHDWAHAASLLLDSGRDEMIVLVLEGLGYGTDDRFWGSEVLFTTFSDFSRLGHLDYIPLIGGDMATRDPRRLVFAIFEKIGKHLLFSDKQAQLFSRIMKNAPLSCSLGRYLDALSCYLDICCKRTYSGEPAMKLERYLSKGAQRYHFDVSVKNNIVDVIDIFAQLDSLVNQPLSEKKKADLAYSFVKAVVDALSTLAVQAADDQGLSSVGVSGGVSYNIPIVEMIEQKVKQAGFSFVAHNRIPNGDGGIAAGQNVIAGTKL